MKCKSNIFLKIKFVTVILLLVTVSACSFSSSREVVYSNDRNQYWLEDLDYIRDTLPSHHNNLYENMSEETFIDKIEQLKKDVPYINDDEIQIRLMEIFTLVKDDHLFIINFHSDIQKVFSTKTFVNIFLESSLQSILPVKTRYFNEGLYITEIDEAYKKALGAKILKINDLPVEEVMQKVQEIIPHSNQYRVKFLFPMHIIHPQVLEHFGLLNNNRISLTLEKDDGSIFKQRVAVKAIEDTKFISLLSNELKGPLYTTKDELYWYQYNAEDNSFYFRLNTYGVKLLQNKRNFDAPSYDSYTAIDEEKEYPFENYFSFTKDMISVIEGREIDKIIIDLRDNNGGNIDKLNQLYDYLYKSKELNLQRKIYIIVNNGCFSAPILDCMRFKENVNAIIIGEPTGEKPFTLVFPCADTLILPNSRLSILYARGKFIPIDNSIDTYVPDIIVENSIKAYKQGIDNVMKVILDMK